MFYTAAMSILSQTVSSTGDLGLYRTRLVTAVVSSLLFTRQIKKSSLFCQSHWFTSPGRLDPAACLLSPRCLAVSQVSTEAGTRAWAVEERPQAKQDTHQIALTERINQLERACNIYPAVQKRNLFLSWAWLCFKHRFLVTSATWCLWGRGCLCHILCKHSSLQRDISECSRARGHRADSCLLVAVHWLPTHHCASFAQNNVKYWPILADIASLILFILPELLTTR